MRKLIDEMAFVNLKSPDINPLDLTNRFGEMSFNNPVSIYFLKNCYDGEFINEGLIRTYPINKTIEYVKNCFKLDDDDIRKVKLENNKENILILIPNVANNIDVVKKAFNVCGYHFSKIAKRKTFDGIEWITMMFEAKFQTDDSKTIRKQETHAYHITPFYNKKSILKIGFSPRSKNKLFEYPGRVFFINGSASEDNIVSMTKQLSDSNNSLGNNGVYAIFDVDLSKIADDVKLFFDPNYKFGFYCYQNIEPDSISRYGTINTNEEDPRIEWN